MMAKKRAIDLAQNSDAEPPKKRRGPGRPFAEGQSGNPGGRPKALKEVQALAGRYTKRAIVALAKILKESPDDKARIAAAEALLNRAWGKPSQAVEVSGPDGEPIESKAEVTAHADPGNAARILEVLARVGVVPVAGRAGRALSGDHAAADEVRAAPAAPATGGVPSP